ncbi:DUF3574 domain-containing protein [Serratia odorifera]|nr:DUF3574 domain-containing protein [Serratia odorifera]MBJ2067018.1 DUF3574 domain-containing protein [Serratia odorifera]PNK91605.1 DUF3574 domain-containing protein [Serratia odorifera]RII72809.1 DUF3574 domain-containing protein [Serratia odorifera]VDZ55123.1 Protein of uncharacterised function (DUF3574) [Serratia odorifera]HEJ9097251.1 DUF3574 domain-containing protein [Serratia odorifera]
MVKTLTWLTTVGAALLLAGCVASSSTPLSAPSSQARCVTGEPMVQTTLYFGLNRPHGPALSGQEWQSFVDRQVTPRFKQGLSVFDARGQWLGHEGQLVRENSKALVLIHMPGTASEGDIEALRTSYKQQFSQDSVMRVDAPVCVAF